MFLSINLTMLTIVSCFLSISLTMLTIVSWLLERFVHVAAYHISAVCFSDDVHEVTFPIGLLTVSFETQFPQICFSLMQLL